MAKGLGLTKLWDLSVSFQSFRAPSAPFSPEEEMLPLRCWPTAMVSASYGGQQCLVSVQAALSSSEALSELKQTETAGVTLASDMAAGAQSSLWAHEQCVCPFNIVFAINEAIGNIYGALLGSCSVSSWLKPSPCVQLAQSPGVPRVQELIGTGEGRELRPDKQALFVSPWLLPRNWKDTSAHRLQT